MGNHKKKLSRSEHHNLDPFYVQNFWQPLVFELGLLYSLQPAMQHGSNAANDKLTEFVELRFGAEKGSRSGGSDLHNLCLLVYIPINFTFKHMFCFNKKKKNIIPPFVDMAYYTG
jgi:hypothetical protein